MSTPMETTPPPTLPHIHLSRRRPESSETTTRGQPRPRRSPSRLDVRTAFRDFSGVIEVLVGSTNDKTRPQVKFLVHKELLISASPFFAGALAGNFVESAEQIVRLPEEKPEIFEWFLQWLYTGQLSVASRYSGLVNRTLANECMGRETMIRGHSVRVSDPSKENVDSDGALRNFSGSPKYFLLIDLWALSDRMLTTQLSNHILDTVARLSHSTNSVPTPSDTFMLYDTVRECSPLRTLVLDLFAYKKTDTLLDTHMDDWHPRFLRDLVVKLKRPGLESIERHELLAWRPRSWSQTKACEGCKETLRPNFSYDKCVACARAFCGNCLRNCGESSGFTDLGGCKPWMGKNMCLKYHEHDDADVCF